jgi:protein-tyrosine phosphatase
MPGDKAEVPDPYFGGSDGFEHVFQLLNQACENITKELKDA